MTDIDPNLVQLGEMVTIQDTVKNVIMGPMVHTAKGQMAVVAFSTEIVFARWSNRARDGKGAYRPAKGVRLVGHQSPIEGLFEFDVIPKQRFKGSDPT